MSAHHTVSLARRFVGPRRTLLLSYASRTTFSPRNFLSELGRDLFITSSAGAETSANTSNRRMSGILTERLSWNEIKDLVHRGNTSDVEAFGVLGRTQEELLRYRAHRAKILEKYASMTDELRARLFGAPLILNQEGKLAVDTADPTASKCYILVMENEFPYYVAPEITHINIWCSNGALSDEVVEGLIAERLPSGTREYVWFVNPPQYQSVRAIWHCHVFVRNLKASARVSKPGEAELMD